MATVAAGFKRQETAPRWLFTLVIFLGSFLLFLVQPLLARMALPKLGGAPSVWNSAMLVYQALLLAGYAYAHLLSRRSSRTQVAVHLGVLALAALTLPLSLVAKTPPTGSDPVLWVPWLLLLSVGPLFFAISAQSPLLQRWLALSGRGDPYPLFVASNLGSFSGLLAYPLLLEPLLGVSTQSLWWSFAYALLILGVAACGLPLLRNSQPAPPPASVTPLPWRTLARWALIAAVPSGLMLSTTLHLTTDVAPMPLLWVIPLGLYLLSFSIAFASRRGAARVTSGMAPFAVVLAAVTMFIAGGDLLPMVVMIAIATMFLVSCALHARLFDERPEPAQLTLFYLALSLGGVLGGIFCALLAPLLFDWTYEHPLLLLAAAWLLGGRQPLEGIAEMSRRPAVQLALWLLAGVLLAAVALFGFLQDRDLLVMLASLAAILAVFALGERRLFLVAVATSLLGAGAIERLSASARPGELTRSYFGIYRVIERPGALTLVHGTTTHGLQLTGDPARRRTATSYYWAGSGVGTVLSNLPQIVGPQARVGSVGLGLGTLACYARPGELWSFYEIDPTVVELARSQRFHFLRDCAPDAPIVIGDARLRLAEAASATYDVLVIDAFSSDAIPMHLLTREAFETYARVLRPGGLLLVHISNRHLQLRPVVWGSGSHVGMSGLIASAPGEPDVGGFISVWTVLSADRAQLERVKATDPNLWVNLPLGRPVRWSDDHASILPVLKTPW